MSVVNQMLRDLQQRQDSTKQLPLQSLDNKSNISFYFLLVFGSVVMLLCFYLWFSQDTHTPPLSSENRSLIIDNSIAKEDFNIAQIDVNHQITNANISTPILIDKSESNDISILTPAINKTALKPAEIVPPIEINISGDSSKTNSKNNLILKNINDIAPDTQNTEKANTPNSSIRNSQQPADSPQVIKQSDETRLSFQLEEIKNNFSFNGLQKTKDRLIHLLNTNPSFHSARLYLIKLLWQKNDKDVEEVINTSIRLYPNQSAFRLAAARYFFEKKDYQQAERAIQNIEPDTNNLSELLQMRAIIRQKQNHHTLAIEDYTAILQLSPDKGDIYLALGISLEALNRNQQALLSFKKAELDQRLSIRQLQFVRNKIRQLIQHTQG